MRPRPVGGRPDGGSPPPPSRAPDDARRQPSGPRPHPPPPAPRPPSLSLGVAAEGATSKEFAWFVDMEHNLHPQYDGQILWGRDAADAYVQHFSERELPAERRDADSAMRFPWPACTPEQPASVSRRPRPFSGPNNNRVPDPRPCIPTRAAPVPAP